MLRLPAELLLLLLFLNAYCISRAKDDVSNQFVAVNLSQLHICVCITFISRQTVCVIMQCQCQVTLGTFGCWFESPFSTRINRISRSVPDASDSNQPDAGSGFEPHQFRATLVFTSWRRSWRHNAVTQLFDILYSSNKIIKFDQHYYLINEFVIDA